MTAFNILSALALKNTKVESPIGEDIGTLEDIMLDITTGGVAYVVLLFGDVIGMIDNKLIAIPWSMLTIDMANERIIMDVDKVRLKNAPSLDKDNLPLTPDPDWLESVYKYYSVAPYWIPLRRQSGQ